MINPDSDALKILAESHFSILVSEKHGSRGLQMLRSLLNESRKILQNIDLYASGAQIVIFKRLNDDSELPSRQTAKSLATVASLANEIPLTGQQTIEILEDTTAVLWKFSSISPSTISNSAVVYEFNQGVDRIWAKGEYKEMPKLGGAYRSVFAIPYFGDLEEALEQYKTTMVRHSRCPHLSKMWHDNNRIFLKNAQEEVMRRSLAFFLTVALRGGVEVKEEQNVDETKPVDVKVTWIRSNHLALIEIKWLGTPRSEDGKVGKPYYDSRAKSGARQLADYLDRNKPHAAEQNTRGVLVVIDCRRAGLNDTSNIISRENGMKYEHSEITYDPAYHISRTDFAPPLRMFAEPKCID